MRTDRRRLLKGGSLAALGAGFLSRFDRTASAQGRPPSLRALLAGQARGASEKMLLGPKAGEEGPPPAAPADRLPRAWNEATVRRFKETLAERDIRAFLVRDPLNVIYLTGYWHTTTERPQAVYMNADDADPWFLYPGLDRDIVTTWWFGGGWMYFDYLHGEGAFPHEGRVQQGATVDLWRFLLDGIRKHKVQGTRIGVDGELYPSQLAKAKEVLPGVEWVDISEALMKMRQVKTPEELALWRRAVAQPVSAQTSTVSDPVGDARFNAPAFQDIVSGQVTKTASGDFELLMVMAGPVPVAPPLPPPANSEIGWAWSFNLDPTSDPQGYPGSPGLALPAEFVVVVSWDGTAFEGTAIDRRPLLTGGEAILTPVPFSINGTIVEAVLASTLIGNVPPSFSWGPRTVDWQVQLGQEALMQLISPKQSLTPHQRCKQKPVTDQNRRRKPSARYAL